MYIPQNRPNYWAKLQKPASSTLLAHGYLHDWQGVAPFSKLLLFALPGRRRLLGKLLSSSNIGFTRSDQMLNRPPELHRASVESSHSVIQIPFELLCCALKVVEANFR
ncbi:hypothetical protein I7I51_03159 [Histoplasma capsulatum]|uniref:Uncharacterized protein n=1 Tax=Ajellomyces capsulatus TaxID=5037 RepID=A0A8A1MSB3_AJECA|nr:hypothetical protein I7I51_03159 [Histoplasma capsulatum]